MNPQKLPFSGLKLFRAILWTMVVVVAIAAGALYVMKPPASVVGLSAAPFTVHSTEGGDFTQASLKGTPTLLFFGYTFCPDVCPTTLAELTALRSGLKLTPQALRIVFTTVDPQRDTLPVLRQYLSGFDSPVIGLSGTPADVDAIEAAFGIYAKKGADDGTGTYLVDHTATVFLLGHDGEFEGTIAYGENQAAASEKVKRLVGG